MGDRRAHLDHAVRALGSVLTNVRVSSFHETAPFGVGPEHATYLNAALTGYTELAPRDLLNRLLKIEDERGRVRPYTMAPRSLDLDLILYSDRIIAEDGLRIPHPRFRERPFVLTPLAEIASEMVDPETSRTVASLAAGLHS